MTNKDYYIDEQLFFAKLNKLLILENPDEILRQLLNDYELNKIINIFESYFSKIENNCFISYFEEERYKMIDLIQILIFTKIRDSRYDEGIDDDFFNQEFIDKLLNHVKRLQNISSDNKEMYESTLLSYRHITESKNKEFYLKLCYLVDEDVIKYINYKDYHLNLSESNYIFYICSLFSYYYNITLTLDKEIAYQKIKKIIFYKHKELQKERVQLLYMVKKMLNMEYTELGYDDLCNDLYLDIDDAEPPIYKFKDNIVDINKYKKR